MKDEKKKYQRDPITHLMEECAELIQILCKVQDFGWNNWHPDDKEETPNFKLVLKEIGDVKKRIIEMEEHITSLTLRYEPTTSKQIKE